jgi:hypothetical protein
MLVTIILALWFYTEIYSRSDFGSCAEYEKAMERCMEAFGGHATFVHHLVFGLITAAVVQQLGGCSDGRTDLYSRVHRSIKDKSRRSMIASSPPTQDII